MIGKLNEKENVQKYDKQLQHNECFDQKVTFVDNRNDKTNEERTLHIYYKG